MEIFIRQTVHQIKEAYPFLDRLTKRFPKLFMPDHAKVSVDYRVAKAAAHFLVGVASCFVAFQAVMHAPACFIPAFCLGVGCGIVAYVAQRIIRRKIQYEGSWSMLYLQGCSILKREWRWLEACSVGGVILLTYVLTSKLMRVAPAWACRQNAAGTGIWVGYLVCDYGAYLFRTRSKGAAVAARRLSIPQSG